MTDSAMDRRHFHRTVGAVAAAPLVVALAGPSCAEDADASSSTPKAAAAPPGTTPPSTPPSMAPLSDVEHYLALIALIDPERLRGEHLAALREDVAANLASSRKLSAFALTNADEPAPVFAAWRAEG